MIFVNVLIWLGIYNGASIEAIKNDSILSLAAGLIDLSIFAIFGCLNLMSYFLVLKLLESGRFKNKIEKLNIGWLTWYINLYKNTTWIFIALEFVCLLFILGVFVWVSYQLLMYYNP